MVTDHSSITIYHCYAIFLGKAGTDRSAVGCPDETPIFDVWLLADEVWQKMLDAGLRAMLLSDSSKYRDPDESLVEYFHDLIDRDGFVTDPAYWCEARQSWRQFLTDYRWPFGKDIEQQRQIDRLRLQVIETEEPRVSPPRGICSPVKTGEIHQFEGMVQRVFPDAQAATTERNDND